MMRTRIIGLLLWLVPQAFAQQLASPDGNLQLRVQLDNGVPVYQLDYKGTAVIAPSKLGLEMEEASLSGGFMQADVQTASFDETWTPVWGEYSHIRNQYNEMAVTLVQKEQHERTVVLRFRLFNDGLGFRYELPQQKSLNYLIVKEECTEFNLTGNHKMFCMPGDYDTNEFAYTTALLSDIKEGMEKNLRKKGYESRATAFTVQTPLMMKTADGLYINIHEAALVDYSGMLLNVDDRAFRLSTHLTPDKLGKKGYLQLPCHTPWRTVIVSDDARDIDRKSVV